MSVFVLFDFHKHFSEMEPPYLNYIFLSSICLLSAFVATIFYYLNITQRRHEPRGCRKLGPAVPSNLEDEHDKRYSKGSPEQRVNGISLYKVKSLWIYPVKSCRGVELTKGNVVITGMQYDRMFSFAQYIGAFPASSIDSKSETKTGWKFITQREKPQLARVKTEVWVPDQSSITYDLQEPNVQSQGVLVIKFPRHDGFWGWLTNALFNFGLSGFERSFEVPFNPTLEQIEKNGYSKEAMTIWKDIPQSLLIASTSPSENNMILKELSRFIGVSNSLALFRTAAEPNREVYRCAPGKEELGYQSRVGFQDAYPLHILNLASVRDVGKKLSKGSPRLSAMQFRSNVLVTGPEAYGEDSWKKIRIGGFEYYVCCRTARCTLPNVNQITGIKDRNEPNKTLREFRAIDPGAGKNACLGMMMVPVSQHSVIKVGDPIEVLETGEHFYLKQ